MSKIHQQTIYAFVGFLLLLFPSILLLCCFSSLPGGPRAIYSLFSLLFSRRPLQFLFPSLFLISDGVRVTEGAWLVGVASHSSPSLFLLPLFLSFSLSNPLQDTIDIHTHSHFPFFLCFIFLLSRSLAFSHPSSSRKLLVLVMLGPSSLHSSSLIRRRKRSSNQGKKPYTQWKRRRTKIFPRTFENENE